jgi:hypothetical protein
VCVRVCMSGEDCVDYCGMRCELWSMCCCVVRNDACCGVVWNDACCVSGIECLEALSEEWGAVTYNSSLHVIAE